MIRRVALIAALSSLVGSTGAQTPAIRTGNPTPLEATFAYSGDRTNGVVGGCGCFWMSGGKAEASSYFGHGISAVAELAGEHADSINSAHESLSFVAYLFGPRYSLRIRSPFAPFAQLLAGGAHGFDALFPNPNGSNVTPDAFAFAAGGGLNVDLSRRFAVRAVQADYLETRFPNTTTNQQSHLRISGGIVFRFGGNGK
jgi:hypothetical protein